MTFDQYTHTIDFLVMIDAPEPARIRAAYLAGGRRGDPDPSDGYLYERLRSAFG
jgi:hypothetical protein